MKDTPKEAQEVARRIVDTWQDRCLEESLGKNVIILIDAIAAALVEQDERVAKELRVMDCMGKFAVDMDKARGEEIDALCTRAEQAEAKLEDSVDDKELGEFQEQVRNLVIKESGAPENLIDGAGSDAGWQEFTLCEIQQGLIYLKDAMDFELGKKLAAAEQRASEAEKNLIKANANHEEFERKWYLEMDAKEKAEQRCRELESGLKNQERVIEVGNDLFREAVRPVLHLWTESERPPSVQMICLKLRELEAALQPFAEHDTPKGIRALAEGDFRAARAALKREGRWNTV